MKYSPNGHFSISSDEVPRGVPIENILTESAINYFMFSILENDMYAI